MKNRQLLSVIAAGVLSLTSFGVAQATPIDDITDSAKNVLSTVYSKSSNPGIMQQLETAEASVVGTGANYAAAIAGLTYNTNYVASVVQTSASSGYSDAVTITLGAQPYVPAVLAGKTFLMTYKGSAAGWACTYSKSSGTSAAAQNVDLEKVTSAQMGAAVSAFGTINLIKTAGVNCLAAA